MTKITKKSAIAWRVASPTSRTVELEIEALEALPDDAPPVEIWRALSRCAGRPEYARIDGDACARYAYQAEGESPPPAPRW